VNALSEPVALGPRTARNRIVFGPHETNLARRRSISDRHVAYYRRRAAGGAGVIVVEEASVHESDWPYERSPLAAESAEGWSAVAGACHDEGALVLAALGHAGGQGSSAYHQAPLLAPGRVPEVATREVPKQMEDEDIEAVIAGFGSAAALAVSSGLDGVEVNAGQHSLVRQFLSGLTNTRTDRWGEDRTLFARRVLHAVRQALEAGGGILGLRLSCDELAPWAGIVPEAGATLAAALAPLVDYLTVVRGSIYTVSATRPDGHVEPGFNRDLTALVRRAVRGAGATAAVVAQGSIVDPAMAEAFVADGVCDLVEMTRAQIADPDLARAVGEGAAHRVRPCILCNQVCQVRDVRNPIVSCVAEPSAGHETEDDPVPDSVLGVHAKSATGLDVLVVGGGVAGLECARVAVLAGHRVRLAERNGWLGGALRVAAAGAGRSRLALLTDWLAAQCTALGVEVTTDTEITADDVASHEGPVILCTGSLPGRPTYAIDPGAVVRSAAEALATAGPPGTPLADAWPAGPVAVWDPVGGPVGVSVAERFRSDGHAVTLLTPDLVVGAQLSLTGDLAPANTRLQAAGVMLRTRAVLRTVRPGEVEVEDRFSGIRTVIEAAVLIDAGYRLPDDRLWRQTGSTLPRAGDAVAPRTAYEAVLEGRRAALGLQPAWADR